MEHNINKAKFTHITIALRDELSFLNTSVFYTSHQTITKEIITHLITQIDLNQLY